MKNKKIIIVGWEDNYSRKLLEKDMKKISDISSDYNPMHLDVNCSFVYIGDHLPDMGNPKFYNVDGIQHSSEEKKKAV